MLNSYESFDDVIKELSIFDLFKAQMKYYF